MDQLQNFGDERQTYFCAYCGGETETRDHVPSKILLDEPYPTNLPIVPACRSCNEGFSLDEEYLACLVECTLTGSVKPNDVSRAKIKRILEKKPALVAKLSQSRQEMRTGEIQFNVETERIRNVILKLARGHAAFELNEPQLNEPSSVIFVPFHIMALDVLENFEAPPWSSIWPEVGSRAMQRLIEFNSDMVLGWVVVQSGRYRYLTSVGEDVIVRIAINEYLGCEVIWD